ncbi:MAG: hypothetical protein Q9165_006732 [Trypethelium subeluteriae]
MDSGICISLVERLSGHPSAQEVMARLERWQRPAEEKTIAEAAAKQDAKDRQIADRIRARREGHAEDVHGLREVEEKSRKEQLDKKNAYSGQMKQQGKQCASGETVVEERNINDCLNDAHAMERGESKAKAKVQWSSLPKRPREQYRALMDGTGGDKTVSPYPTSNTLTPGHYENESVHQVLMKSPAPPKSSHRPVRSFPKVAQPITPILNQEPSGMTLFPRYSNANPEAPALSALHPSLCSPVPSPIRQEPRGDAVSTHDIGETNITFFEQYETVAQSFSLDPSRDPIDRSSSGSPCSILSKDTNYDPSNCKRNCDNSGDMGVSYQLGPCLCNQCRPNHAAADLSSSSTRRPRAEYFSRQARASKADGAADTRPTDLSLIATTPTQSRWNAWWAALAPFPSLSKSSSRSRSKRSAAAQFRPSPPPSPLLPEAQESLLGPDGGGSGSRQAGGWWWWWEVQEEQAEEERERRREERERLEGWERRWMRRQERAREYSLSQGYVQ